MKDSSIPLAPIQKLAWFNLIVFAISTGLYLVAVPFLAWHFHRTLVAAALPSLGMFGVCGLWGLGVYFYYDRRRHAKVTFDEREQAIQQRAATIGMALFWEVFVIVCMGVWAFLYYVRQEATIPIGFLPSLVMFGFIVFMVTQSIAILVQYRRSANDDAL